MAEFVIFKDWDFSLLHWSEICSELKCFICLGWVEVVPSCSLSSHHPLLQYKEWSLNLSLVVISHSLVYHVVKSRSRISFQWRLCRFLDVFVFSVCFIECHFSSITASHEVSRWQLYLVQYLYIYIYSGCLETWC